MKHCCRCPAVCLDSQMSPGAQWEAYSESYLGGLWSADQSQLLPSSKPGTAHCNTKRHIPECHHLDNDISTVYKTPKVWSSKIKMLNAENIKAEILKLYFLLWNAINKTSRNKTSREEVLILVYARKAQCCGQNEPGSVYMSARARALNDLNLPWRVYHSFLLIRK